MRDELGDRMKNNYESRCQSYLIKRTPVIIRIDGRAFHSFTKYMDKPFDAVLREAFLETCSQLVTHIQNAKCLYWQSDEISILLTDYDSLETGAWFDYKIQKLCSIAASMATLYFNQNFYDVYKFFGHQEERYSNVLNTAMFDARCFNIPKEEVNNYFVWRQKDCIRNSISQVGRANFSHKELNRCSSQDIIDKLKDKGIDYYKDFSATEQYGLFMDNKESYTVVNFHERPEVINEIVF